VSLLPIQVLYRKLLQNQALRLKQAIENTSEIGSKMLAYSSKKADFVRAAVAIDNAASTTTDGNGRSRKGRYLMQDVPVGQRG